MFAVIYRANRHNTSLQCHFGGGACQDRKQKLALLIGNQHYKLQAINLANPHNDIVAVGNA